MAANPYSFVTKSITQPELSFDHKNLFLALATNFPGPIALPEYI